MSRTDHAAEARDLWDAVREWQEREGVTDATMLTGAIEAHAHETAAATWALVEAQREANDIARASARTALAQLRVGVADLPLLLNLAVRPVGEYGIDLVPEVASALGIDNDKETN